MLPLPESGSAEATSFPLSGPTLCTQPYNLSDDDPRPQGNLQNGAFGWVFCPTETSVGSAVRRSTFTLPRWSTHPRKACTDCCPRKFWRTGGCRWHRLIPLGRRCSVDYSSCRFPIQTSAASTLEIRVCSQRFSAKAPTTSQWVHLKIRV